jgi:nucleoid-associated protein YgaU
MRRAKKIAIVVTILAVGTAVALCFRRPDEVTPQKDGATFTRERIADTGKSEARPAVAPPKRGSAYQPLDETAAKPKLAGRIEPVASPLIPIGGMGAPTIGANAPPLRAAGETLSRERPGIAVDTSLTVERPAVQPPKAEQKPLGWREPKSSFEHGSKSLTNSDDIGEFTVNMEPAEKHKIVDGDTLASLAARYLGDASRAADIYNYNRDVLTSIELLPIGKELRIPAQEYRRPTVEPDVGPVDGVDRRDKLNLVPIVAAEPPREAPIQKAIQLPVGLGAVKSVAPAADGAAYVVQPYDTLALISRRVYGDLTHQDAIIAANREQLKTARDLRPGMTLILPRRTK